MGVRSALFGMALAVLFAVAPASVFAATSDGVSVSGVLFLDLDADGTRDGGEPGRADVPVTLRTAATILDATTTAADGSWTFGNVQSGTYEVLVESPIDHVITGGTLPGLSPDAGRATLEVGSSDVADAGSVGLGSPATSGPDVATTVVLAEDGTTPETFRWELTAHNIGPEDADGPVDLRVVLSADHETTDVAGEDWSCEQSASIVLCQTDRDLPAGGSLPTLSLATQPVGDVGATVSVTGTARLDGVFDAAPLNDEDAASVAISGEVATADADGDGAGYISSAGARTTGLLVAGILAVVAGAAALGGSRRSTPRP